MHNTASDLPSSLGDYKAHVLANWRLLSLFANTGGIGGHVLYTEGGFCRVYFTDRNKCERM